MTKILTIAEPECCGKPTGFAAVIPNENFDTLMEMVLKGLQDEWFYTESVARATVIDEDIDALKEQGYTWIKERFLVEVTILAE